MAVKTTGTIFKVNGTDIGSVMSWGDITFQRGTKDYEPLNSDDVVIAIGRAKAFDMPISVLYNPADTGAQKALKDAVEGGNTVDIDIELSDKGSNNGTTFSWTGAAVSELKITPDQDGDYSASFTLRLPGMPTVTAAS